MNEILKTWMPGWRAAGNLLTVAGREGPGEALRSLRNRCYERYYEYYLGVVTAGVMSAAELGLPNKDSCDYAPSDYYTLFKVLRLAAPNPAEQVLLDYGSGKGRALLVASRLGYKRVIGLEFSGELNEIARQNFVKAGPRLRTCNFELLSGPAEKRPVPEDVTVVYLFNPFTGDILRKCMGHVLESYRANPRKITVICKLPAASQFESELPEYKWLKKVRTWDFTPYLRYWFFEVGDVQ